MSKIGRGLLSLCFVLFIASSAKTTIAEAPKVPLSQLEYYSESLDTPDAIEKEIDFWCKEYHFNYPTLMKWLAKRESRTGQDKRCGDNGKACGLYQWHYNTWKEFQKKFNRYDLSYDNNRDQIVMTILALKNGYWYKWGTLKRRFKGNPI